MSQKFCKDCNKKISYRATRCRSCSKKGERHHLYGKDLSEEHRKKLGDAIREEKNYNWKGGKPKCIDCNKKLARYDAQRCCKCANKIITSLPKFRKLSSERWRGKKNINWKGGITPLVRMIRNLSENEKWRIAVFERDNYTCQKCSVRGKVLHAHHNNKSFVIILNEFINHYSQFSRFKDKEILMKLAVGYKPFWDTNNGNTLCENCHERTGRPQAVIDAYKAAQAALAVPK